MSAHADVSVDIDGVSAWYGDVVAVDDVTMHLAPGVTRSLA
jgi:hypothetical protein